MIGQFFERPAGPGDRIPVIPPLQRMEFRSTVQLNRDQLRIFEVEGRSLFVPLVGFNAHYRWSGGEGQTSASYVVGRNTDGEKMAPFLVSQGPKSFRGLGAREHTLAEARRYRDQALRHLELLPCPLDRKRDLAELVRTVIAA